MVVKLEMVTQVYYFLCRYQYEKKHKTVRAKLWLSGIQLDIICGEEDEEQRYRVEDQVVKIEKS